MKKVFRMAAIAVLALGLTTACKQKAVEPEEIIDSAIEEVAEEIEEVVEDTVVVAPAEPVKKVAKPAAKKQPATADVKSANSSPIQAVNTPGADVRQDKKNAETQAVLENQRVTTDQSKKR